MDLMKELCVYIVLLNQIWFAVCCGHIRRIQADSPPCGRCDTKHACNITTYAVVTGNVLRLRFDPTCPQCICKPMVVRLTKCEGSDPSMQVERQLKDPTDRVTVFTGLKDGFYRVHNRLDETILMSTNNTGFRAGIKKIDRGNKHYNLTCCEVSNKDQEVKTHVFSYLTVVVCGVFVTMMIIGMVVFLKGGITTFPDTNARCIVFNEQSMQLND